MHCINKDVIMGKIVEPGTNLESVLLSPNGSGHASGSSCFSAKGASTVGEKANFKIKPRKSSQEVLLHEKNSVSV